ncbi:MAG: hypothetical protein ACOVP4_04405 [Bacteriovoracaceae bacterium]|jgi:hypothetical protein
MNRLFLLILLTLISCEERFTIVSTGGTTAQDDTQEIVASLQGTFNECIPSPSFPGYYNRVEVVINNNDYSYFFELHSNAICTSSFYRYTHTYEIDKASYQIQGNTEDINLDLRMKEFRIRYIHPFYIGQNHCGMNDWVSGVDKILTGVSCLSILSQYDTFHSSFKAVDELEYIKIKIKTSSLTIPFGFIESGDSADERKESVPVEIDKI